MTGRPVKMSPESRTSLFVETVLAALGVGADNSPLVGVQTTGPYTAVLSVGDSQPGIGGVQLALTTCVGGVSQAVVSPVWWPGSSRALHERRVRYMERLAEAIEAEPAVTGVEFDGARGASVLVRLSYGRARIIREGNNG